MQGDAIQTPSRTRCPLYPCRDVYTTVQPIGSRGQQPPLLPDEALDSLNLQSWMQLPHSYAPSLSSTTVPKVPVSMYCTTYDTQTSDSRTNQSSLSAPHKVTRCVATRCHQCAHLPSDRNSDRQHTPTLASGAKATGRPRSYIMHSPSETHLKADLPPCSMGTVLRFLVFLWPIKYGSSTC